MPQQVGQSQGLVAPGYHEMVAVMCVAKRVLFAHVLLLQHRLTLGGAVELLLATYSLSGDRNPPATPLYSGDESQIREAFADVIMQHAAAAEAVAGQGQQQQQPALAVLHQQLQCLPQTQQLVLQVG